MRCPACEAEVEREDRECPECGEPLRLRRRKDEYDDGGVSTVIPYKNVKALLAYYFGVFGLIPGVGIILGPAALILGLLGLRYARQNPQAKGMGHAIAGIVLGALIVLGYLAVLVLIVIAIATSK